MIKIKQWQTLNIRWIIHIPLLTLGGFCLLISIRQSPPPPHPTGHEKRMYSARNSQILSTRTVYAVQTEWNVMWLVLCSGKHLWGNSHAFNISKNWNLNSCGAEMDFFGGNESALTKKESKSSRTAFVLKIEAAKYFETSAYQSTHYDPGRLRFLPRSRWEQRSYWVITRRVVVIIDVSVQAVGHIHRSQDYPIFGVKNLGPWRRYLVGCSETSVRNYHYSLRNNPECPRRLLDFISTALSTWNIILNIIAVWETNVCVESTRRHVSIVSYCLAGCDAV
jgi:hypothetical protein